VERLKLLLQPLSNLQAKFLSQNLTNCETAHFSLVRADLWITDEVVNELKSLLSYLALLSFVRRKRQECFRTNVPSYLSSTKGAIRKLLLLDFIFPYGQGNS